MRPPRPHAPPLNTASLERLAVHYVGRYATSRAKLAAYLRRKVAERGWEGPAGDVAGLTEKMATLGYVDDRAFAEARGRSLARRGYGARRVEMALRAAGIDAADREAAAPDHEEEVAAVCALARRRRIGPFAPAPGDRAMREKWLAALLRAGHPPLLSRAIVRLEPSEEPDEAILRVAADL